MIHEPQDWLSPAKEQTGDDVFNELADLVRTVVREEIARSRFVTVSPWLTVEETCSYLKLSRAKLLDLRTERNVARTAAAKARIFPPDHMRAGKIYLDRRELDQWMEGL